MSAAILLTALSTIQLADPLDEPEFYCLDVSGWGEKLKIEDPVQAHTCKGPDGADQDFSFAGDKIVYGSSDRCLEVASTRTPLPGSALLVRKCSDSPMQKFDFKKNGQIALQGSKLCLVVGAESAEAFGPSHVWRLLTIAGCTDADSSRSTWQILN